MVRARAVVAEDLGGPPADEEPAVVEAAFCNQVPGSMGSAQERERGERRKAGVREKEIQKENFSVATWSEYIARAPMGGGGGVRHVFARCGAFAVVDERHRLVEPPLRPALFEVAIAAAKAIVGKEKSAKKNTGDAQTKRVFTHEYAPEDIPTNTNTHTRNE